MFEAAIRNDGVQMRTLLSHSTFFNINEPRRSITGMSAVHVAARHGSYLALRQLLDSGGRADLRCSAGLYYMSPLHLAVYFSQENSDKWYDYQKTIKLLLKSSLVYQDVNVLDGLQRTPLHWAAMRGFG